MSDEVDSLTYQPPNWVDRFDWADVFGNDHPVEIDLGCGKGGFLLWAAATQPDRNFLGVDRLLGRLRRAESKARRRELTNVRLLRIEGGYFVEYLAPPRSISAYHIYFPDPWPKRRHHPRRLVQAAFLVPLELSLVADGVVHLATDDVDYFTAQQRAFRESGRFDEQPPLAPADEGLTEFEKIFRAQAKPIHRARWQLRPG